MPAAPVVVVGSVNADLVAVVDRLPRPGETVIGGALERHWGGKGGNQAVAARRYGADVVFVGAVGDDDLGRAAVAALAEEGIDTSRVARRADAATGVALIVVDRDGQNQIAVASGANLAVDAAGLDDLLAGGPGVLLTNFEILDRPLVDAVAAARRHGWRIVVNPAPARALPDALGGSGAILTPNEQEAAELTGAGGARELAGGLGGAVAVTLGAEGARLVTAGGSQHMPAPAVVARDTTGAGDVFNGVLAAALAEGALLPEAVEAGVAAASFAVEIPGARGQLARAELEERLARGAYD